MSSDRGKLGNFLGEVINWTWKEFCDAEKDPKYSGFQSSVFALVRACSDGKLSAIKLAIDRVDGKVETPVRVEYPKVWNLFPEATSVALPPAGTKVAELPSPDSLPEIPPEVLDEDEPKTAATLTLRETLEKMADAPRQVPLLIHEQKKKVEHGEVTDEEHTPFVKSVICANLLILANEKHSFEAITEIFDRIDGKLVEVIRLLGDDIFLVYYAAEAPFGAVKNKEGIYMLEAPTVADIWKEKLDGKKGSR